MQTGVNVATMVRGMRSLQLHGKRQHPGNETMADDSSIKAAEYEKAIPGEMIEEYLQHHFRRQDEDGFEIQDESAD